MIFFRLFFWFFKTGLFAVGGGLATIPFLSDMGARTGWFTAEQLASMIAVSESTPGSMGVNMATYVGFVTAGVPGALIATLGLICPSIIVILIIAKFLQKFRQSQTVDAIFQGLRPASTGLIAAAGLSVAEIALFRGSVALSAVRWDAVILAIGIFVAMRYTPLKKLHPVLFILISAVLGVVFQM